MGLEDYRLTGQLGAGRDGVANQATPIAGGDSVALLRLDRARDDVPRWPALAKRLAIASRLDHPSARSVLELGVDHDPPYVVVVHDERPTLAGGSFRRKVVPVADKVAMAVVVASALAAAHRLGLFHGRLGPWSVRGADPLSLRIDFTGLETGPEASIGGGRALPREAFRAPEEREDDEPTAEADVFRLGGLLSWLLTGETSAALEASRHDLPPDLRALARSMSARGVFDRPTALEAAERLTAIYEANGADRSTVAVVREAATREWSSHRPITVEGPPAPGEIVSLSIGDLPRVGESSSTTHVAGGPAPERLGRFRLLGKLGEGGMGAVYKAEDEVDGGLVALKLLKPELAARPLSLERFRKEARLLSRVRNPYVTNLLEVNEDGGIHYLVMEFVAGESLDRVLKARTHLDERTALEVAADIARGLTDAHRLGIVHRDVKPSNVLVVGDLSADDGAGPFAGTPRVKLADFGLARHAVEEGSQQLTRNGMIVGTPAYMAPEQCSGAAIDPRTDVYAMGATLFHIVAGRPPFIDDDWRVVIGRQIKDDPPALRALNPAVSEACSRIVEKALAKSPEARYPDAEALLFDVERLLRGEPTGLPMHPALPEADPAKVLTYDFTWELDAPARRLWPFVSNTDRIDRAIGFGAVRYTLKFDPTLGVRRFLEDRKAGMTEEGEELPYEWVEGRRLGVFRDFTRGPFRWVVSVVELAPRAGGGTTLTHRLRVEPRGRLLRLAARWGVGKALKRDFGRVYRRIDAAVTGSLGRVATLDPFEPPPALAEPRRRRLDELLAALTARGNDPEVVARLGAFVAEAPDPELARIRPIALARRLGLPEEAVIVACLHGASLGLFVLLWDLLCPVCRIPSEVKETLRVLAEHGRCEACHLDYDLDFSHSVELIFRAHPQVRDADTNTYCAAGPAHSPHVVAQVRLAAGERLELDLGLSEGAYRLRGPQLGWTFDFQVRPGATARRSDLGLAHGPPPGLAASLDAGTQTLGLFNDADCPLVVRVERVVPRDDALTAARASTMAVFRELFPAEVLAPGRLVSVANVSLLVTALDRRATTLYGSLGDARAFAVLHEQYRLTDGVVRREGGAVIKTVGEGVLAAFADPDAAVRAGLLIPLALARGETTRDLRVRGAAHRGPAMAATVNDRLDYFGITIHQALQALAAAPPGALVLTRSVAADPQVAARLSALGVVGAVLDDALPPRPFGPLLSINLETPPLSAPPDGAPPSLALSLEEGAPTALAFP